jgi:hypothetical protein
MAVMAGQPISSAAIDQHRRIPAPLVNSGFVTDNAVIAITGVRLKDRLTRLDPRR